MGGGSIADLAGSDLLPSASAGSMALRKTTCGHPRGVLSFHCKGVDQHVLPAPESQVKTVRASGGYCMKSLRLLVLSVLFSAGLLASTAQAASFQAIDNDKDGTIDLSEVKAVASRRFDQLDRKRTGTLTRAQLGRLRVNRDEFAAADPDNDGTLSKDEYLALVEKRFNALNSDHKGTLTLQQFNSRKALPLRRLL
jgi:hypothetical protein